MGLLFAFMPVLAHKPGGSEDSSAMVARLLFRHAPCASSSSAQGLKFVVLLHLNTNGLRILARQLIAQVVCMLDSPSKII